MLWLPCGWMGLQTAGVGLAWVPVSDCSAAVLAEALLGAATDEVPADRGSKADVETKLQEAFEADPGLALWAVSTAEASGQHHLVDVQSLSAWLAKHCLDALSQGTGDPYPGLDAAAGETVIAECSRLAAASSEAAELARDLARASTPLLADEAFLLGLLHNARRWMELGSHDSSRPEALPRWLTTSLDALTATADDSPAGTYSAVSFVRQGLDILHGRTNPSSDLVAPGPSRPAPFGWSQAIPGAGRALLCLASKLARLNRLESRFRQQLETEKLEAMAEFAAGAGHEINNPLAVIAGRAQLLLRSETNPERRRELALMNGQAMRIYEMISDMMLFARPPAPRLAKCDVSQLVDAVVADMAPKAHERKMLLERIGPREPLLLSADVAQLTVALRAICENALAVLGPGGHIRVCARRVGPDEAQHPAADGLEITIQDNGPGIDPSVRRHLFDPFFSGRGAGRGLGLGLSKCWRIITNHGGTIEVGGEPGRGALFQIRLPARG